MPYLKPSMKEGEVRIPSGCAIAAVISKEGKKMTAKKIIDAMKPMHERSNGLGGGFAGYGIYPDYADSYAFHVFYDDLKARQETERYLDRYFDVVNMSRIPVRPNRNVVDAPLIWRYFVNPLFNRIQEDAEAVILPEAVKLFCANKLECDGNFVHISGK